MGEPFTRNSLNCDRNCAQVHCGQVNPYRLDVLESRNGILINPLNQFTYRHALALKRRPARAFIHGGACALHGRVGGVEAGHQMVAQVLQQHCQRVQVDGLQWQD